MALPPAFFSYLSNASLSNVLSSARSSSEAARRVRAGSASEGQQADVVQLSAAGVEMPVGAGLYEVARVPIFNFSDESFPAASPSVTSKEPDEAQVSPRKLMHRLEESFQRLGLDSKHTQRLLQLARLVSRLDPKAFQRMVAQLERFAETVSEEGDGAAGEVEAAASEAGAVESRFSLEHISLRVSVVEVKASAGDGEESVSAQRVQIQFERLQISITQAGEQKAGPLVLDLDGGGADLRPTSDGVLFDLLGTAPLSGGLALLFRDSNGDGVSSLAEVGSLEELGIAEISTLFDDDRRTAGDGLYQVSSSSFTRLDGSQGKVFDYFFGSPSV